VWLDRDRTGESGVPSLAHVHSADGVADAASRIVERVDPAKNLVCC
jgi:hypothetical protein